MSYTQALGREFWFDFDDYFKFKSRQNGLFERYEAFGGYLAPSDKWIEARRALNVDIFNTFCDDNKENILFVAGEQREYFLKYFDNEFDDIVRAFQDFAFGVLASPDSTERPREPVHTMNGGLAARDYLSWHGFIEAALVLGDEPAVWTNIRWINGMAWELQVKARPQEIYPNQNEPLAQPIIEAITSKWQGRSQEEIAVEFDNYRRRPIDWLS